MTPAQLQEQLNKISDELYQACQEMAAIASAKGTRWLELRKDCKTNAEADQLWASSPAGIKEVYLKWHIKGLQAKRGAILQEVKSNNNSY